MPRMTVTAIARMNAVRSSRRIAQTAIWQVTELRIRRIVAGPTSGNAETSKAWPVSGLSGGHCTAFARRLK